MIYRTKIWVKIIYRTKIRVKIIYCTKIIFNWLKHMSLTRLYNMQMTFTVYTVCMLFSILYHLINRQIVPSEGNPNCWQTTEASTSSHLSSHTVPHTPPMHTSTLPLPSSSPFTNLTSLPLHARGPIMTTNTLIYSQLTNYHFRHGMLKPVGGKQVLSKPSKYSTASREIILLALQEASHTICMHCA